MRSKLKMSGVKRMRGRSRLSWNFNREYSCVRHAERGPGASIIIIIGRYGIWICAASGRRCTTGAGDTSAPNVGKDFLKKCSFAGRYQRFTHRVAVKTVDLLRRRSSLKAVAEATGTSLSGVNRILNTLTVPKPEALPEAISFDEFRGNLGGERFQCIVTDPLNRRVLDILPKRTVESMQDYLRPLVVRTSPASVREFCYPSLYTPTYVTEPIKGRGIEDFVPAW